MKSTIAINNFATNMKMHFVFVFFSDTRTRTTKLSREDPANCNKSSHLHSLQNSPPGQNKSLEQTGGATFLKMKIYIFRYIFPQKMISFVEKEGKQPDVTYKDQFPQLSFLQFCFLWVESKISLPFLYEFSIWFTF